MALILSETYFSLPNRGLSLSEKSSERNLSNQFRRCRSHSNSLIDSLYGMLFFSETINENMRKIKFLFSKL